MLGVKSPVDASAFDETINGVIGEKMVEIPVNIKKKVDEIKGDLETKGEYEAKVGKKGKLTKLSKDSSNGEIIGLAGMMEAGPTFREAIVEQIWEQLSGEVETQFDEAGVSFGKKMLMKGTEKAVVKAINKALETAITKAIEKLSSEEEV